MFQKTVNTFSAPGIAGDFYDESPRRVQPAIANGVVTIGNPVWYSDATTDPLKVTASAGATLLGVVVNGKELVRANGLTAGLDVASGSVVSVCTMGRVWIKVATDVTVGDTIHFDASTGEYSNTASVSNPIGKAVIVNAAAGEMAVVEIG